jgi:acetylornithine deacetylase
MTAVASLEAAERSVLAALHAREDELIAFARELIATPSPNPGGDERAVVAVTRDALASFGYGRFDVHAAVPERPSLVAHLDLGAGPSLVLSGHLDTKPPGDDAAWAHPPYGAEIHDGRLHGVGSSDMKGAVAAMAFAGRALAEGGVARGSLRLLLTADEEAGGALGARYVAERLEPADGVIVGEATGISQPWEYLAVAARGVACFRVVVRGTQMHSSLTDRLPSVNASVRMGAVLTAFGERFAPRFELADGCPPCRPSVNAGVLVEGGVYYGVCPGEAWFGVDVRTVPGMTLERLRDDVEAFLAELRAADDELDVVAVWPDDIAWFSPSQIDPRHRLVEAARGAAASVLGRPLPDGVFPGGTEAAFWAAAGLPSVSALGPGCLAAAHRPNESVSVEEILQASRIYALAAVRFLAAEDGA